MDYDVIVRQIKWNSPEYYSEIQLRNKVLRLPLGLDLLKEDLSAEKHYVHVGAFQGEAMVGVMILKDLGDNITQVKQVAVEESVRGKNVGRKMFDFSHDLLQRKGCNIVTLDARKSAMGFYEKLGYTTVSDEFEEVGLPHFTMIKTLESIKEEAFYIPVPLEAVFG